MNMIRPFFAVCAALALGGVSLPAKPLEIWISSYQDKVYYEEMVKLYQAKDPKFAANPDAHTADPASA